MLAPPGDPGPPPAGIAPLRLLILPVGVLWIGLALAVLALGLLPDPIDTTPLDWQFFTRQPYCGSPCWSGIEPGVTTLEQALAILQVHPLVAEIIERPEANVVYWRWQSARLPYIDGTTEGALYYLDDGTVETVTLPTRVPWTAFHVLWGAPDTVQVARGWQRGTISRTLYLIYPAYNVRLEIGWVCPVTFADFRQATATIIYTSIAAPRSLNEPLAPHCFESVEF